MALGEKREIDDVNCGGKHRESSRGVDDKWFWKRVSANRKIKITLNYRDYLYEIRCRRRL